MGVELQSSIKVDRQITFLIACMRLYKTLSVGRLVGRLVRPSLIARSTRLMAIGLVLTFFSDDRKGVKLFFKKIDFNKCVFFIVCLSISPSNKASLSIYQIRHDCQVCPSVHPIRPVCQSIKSGMFGSPSNQACLANQQCPAVPRL